MHFLVLLSAFVACAAGKCYNRLYSSKYLLGWPNSIHNAMKYIVNLYITRCNICA